MDVEDLCHGFCCASGFITNDEQLKQVVEVGLEIVLRDDLRAIDRIPGYWFSTGQLASRSVA